MLERQNLWHPSEGHKYFDECIHKISVGEKKKLWDQGKEDKISDKI